MRHSIRRMPELPDVVVYIEALERRVGGARLERVRVLSPFVLRSVDPPLAAAAGRTVSGLRRLGKRIVVGLESDLFLVLHLMIAGRLHWRPAGARPPGKIGLAAFDFATGTLVMTEAGTKKRAAIHLVRGEEALREHDPGGLEVLEADLTAFRAARPFSGSSTPRTRRTTARAARRAAGSSPTARSHGCSRRIGRGRSSSSKNDRLAVGRGARGVIPLVLPCDELVRPDEPFGGDDLLQGGEPVMVVVAPVVHFAARAGRRDLVGQVRRPLLPREEAARVERHGHAEGLRLPRLPEDGSFLIPWDLRQGRKIRRRHAPTDVTRDRGERT